MRTYSTRDKKQITRALARIISRQRELELHVRGTEQHFTSKPLALTSAGRQAHGPDGADRVCLAIDRVVPEEGNSLIRSSRELLVETVLSGNVFRFTTRYEGPYMMGTHEAVAVSFPELLVMEEHRIEERKVPAMPSFLSVEFVHEDENRGEKTYSLPVINRSTSGLGLLVTDKDVELVELLESGDRIPDMTFFAESAVIKVDATVAHVTKIEEGIHEGSYVIGIVSPRYSHEP